VRRTAEDFAAGAIPSRAGKSYRLYALRVGIPHELNKLISQEAALHSMDKSDYVRAALRFALANQMDARAALDSEIELDASRYDFE